MWIRNEWVRRDNGSWVQDHTWHCLVNVPATDAVIEDICTAWSSSHQWLRTDDLIIGIPPDDDYGKYLIVFSRS